MKKIILGCAIASMLVATSCKKDVDGCKDPDAVSYNIDDDNNFNCIYEGSINFWYNEEVAKKINLSDSTFLKFYLDGKLIGSKAGDNYFESSPECGVEGTVTTNIELGNENVKLFTVRVERQNGVILWNKDIEVLANKCESIQLTLSSIY